MEQRIVIEIERIIQRARVTIERIGPKPVPPRARTRIVGKEIDITPRPVLRLVRRAA